MGIGCDVKYQTNREALPLFLFLCISHSLSLSPPQSSILYIVAIYTVEEADAMKAVVYTVTAMGGVGQVSKDHTLCFLVTQLIRD